MIDINDRTLYQLCTVKSYPCTVRFVHPGMRIYDRNRQNIVITSEDNCFLVTGPAGEREVYNESDFLSGFDFPTDEKNRKKLLKGKVFKIKARQGTGKCWYLRIPADERFTIYSDKGIIQGNIHDCSIEHAQGDCVICPIAADGGPNMKLKTLMNGMVFNERYDT